MVVRAERATRVVEVDIYCMWKIENKIRENFQCTRIIITAAELDFIPDSLFVSFIIASIRIVYAVM